MFDHICCPDWDGVECHSKTPSLRKPFYLLDNWYFHKEGQTTRDSKVLPPQRVWATLFLVLVHERKAERAIAVKRHGQRYIAKALLKLI